MSNYFQKLITYLISVIILIFLGIANWYWPLYNWFGDTQIMRFVWLGIFFVILDIIFELTSKAVAQVRLMTEAMGFAKKIRKMGNGFYVVSKFVLEDKFKADHIIIGSSGVWLITVRDDVGKISFNGDELTRNDEVLRGSLSGSLEKAFALSGFIRTKLGKEVKVAPVIAFSSSQADLIDMPKSVRGVFISSGKNTVQLIENTDFQLVDKNTIEEIYKILKK